MSSGLSRRARPASRRSRSLLPIPNRANILESTPPLADIAELNLQHYQTQSDLSNQLHISAVPMLAFYGFPQAAEEVSAGPARRSHSCRRTGGISSPAAAAMTLSSSSWTGSLSRSAAWALLPCLGKSSGLRRQRPSASIAAKATAP